MKRTLIPVLVLALLLAAGDSLAQSRRGQIELFGGAAFPLGPDFFKDYYKVGISGHGQYVFFPNPSVGVVSGRRSARTCRTGRRRAVRASSNWASASGPTSPRPKLPPSSSSSAWGPSTSSMRSTR
jgi:hypothetical protein